MHDNHQPGCQGMIAGLIRELSLLGTLQLIWDVCEIELVNAETDEAKEYWARKERLMNRICTQMRVPLNLDNNIPEIKPVRDDELGDF